MPLPPQNFVAGPVCVSCIRMAPNFRSASLCAGINKSYVCMKISWMLSWVKHFSLKSDARNAHNPSCFIPPYPNLRVSFTPYTDAARRTSRLSRLSAPRSAQRQRLARLCISYQLLHHYIYIIILPINLRSSSSSPSSLPHQHCTFRPCASSSANDGRRARTTTPSWQPTLTGTDYAHGHVPSSLCHL